MTELRFLQVSDLHLCSAFESLSAAEAKKRQMGQRAMLYKISNLAEAKCVDAVLMPGDVFDSDNIDNETLVDFSRAFGSLSCPIIISPGNHDPYTAHCVWNKENLPDNIYVFSRSKIECVKFPNINARFFGGAFTGITCPPMLRNFKAPKKVSNIADIMVLHGEVRYAHSEQNAINSKDIELSNMDYIALGHVHARTNLQFSGKTAFAYSGIPEGRGFDETGIKGVLLITVSNYEVSDKFIPLSGVKYEIITVDVTGKEVLSEILSSTDKLDKTDCCRIVLCGEVQNEIDLQQLRNNLCGRFSLLQLRDETIITKNLWEFVDSDTLKGVFIDKLSKKKLSAKTDEELKIIELAAKYGVAAMENIGEI